MRSWPISAEGSTRSRRTASSLGVADPGDPASQRIGFKPNRSVLPESITQAQRQAITLRSRMPVSSRQRLPSRASCSIGPCWRPRRGWPSALPPGPDAPAIGRLAEALRASSGCVTSMVSPSAARARGRPGTGTSPRVGMHPGGWAQVLRAMSREGILDDELFHDGHHPSLLSHIGLAQAIMDQLLRPTAGAGTRRQQVPDHRRGRVCRSIRGRCQDLVRRLHEIRHVLQAPGEARLTRPNDSRSIFG